MRRITVVDPPCYLIKGDEPGVKIRDGREYEVSLLSDELRDEIVNCLGLCRGAIEQEYGNKQDWQGCPMPCFIWCEAYQSINRILEKLK